MFESPEALQRLVNRAAAEQRLQEQIQRAQQAGDQDAVWFYGQKPEVQATLRAREAIGDAVSAARQGDAAGTQRGIQTAIDQTLHHGAQLVKPERRPPPRRKRGR